MQTEGADDEVSQQFAEACQWDIGDQGHVDSCGWWQQVYLQSAERLVSSEAHPA